VPRAGRDGERFCFDCGGIDSQDSLDEERRARVLFQQRTTFLFVIRSHKMRA
jgi:hypothetical protein